METVLIDANVLIDVAMNDPIHSEWSVRPLRQLQRHSHLVVNVVIYAEIFPLWKSDSRTQRFLAKAKIQKLLLLYSAASPTSRAFLQYRKRGGTKAAPLPDFFIGDHAEAEGLTILTRDGTRYRTYFPTVDLISPDTHP